MPRSPDRRRSRSMERDRDRRRRRSPEWPRCDRRDERRRSPMRHSRDRPQGSWSRPRSYNDRNDKLFDTPKPQADADLEEKTPDELEMMRIMGFCGFDTTKGQTVEEKHTRQPV